jgi:L-serine dehydratase
MRQTSIFNQVLGPVMRGPSSSHTAGAFHIAHIVRSLAGGRPDKVVCAFDPGGSYAHTYSQQGADRAFAMGLLGLELTDERFFGALALAREGGLELRFEVRPLAVNDHPNSVEITAERGVGRLRVAARSIGGGEIELTALNGHPVLLNGTAHVLAAEADGQALPELLRRVEALGALAEPVQVAPGGGFLLALRNAPAPPAWLEELRALPGLNRLYQADPVYFVQPGRAPYTSGAEFIAAAQETGLSLGELALRYEAELLGLAPQAVLDEMLRRYGVMAQAVAAGLAEDFTGMQLLAPSAGTILRSGRPVIGGPHLRAAARAMAVMHVNGAMGVVCAAPTGGAAGTIPGAIVTLEEELHLDRNAVARALLAAGLIGVVVAQRATFAAEVAGCQVEIGAAGAMAAAAVVDAAGGTARQACDAAAIAFHNTMGSVCDPVQGVVEIPCHTRNAAAAANAFLCADLILGGYGNPIPLDETIDAVLEVGRMMPPELRCTAKGGLATTPSALSMPCRACDGCRPPAAR